MTTTNTTTPAWNGQRTHYDVIVVGCGPVGATLAGYLGNAGWSVAILDRDTEVFPVPRAMGFDEETLRILHDLDVLEQIVDRDSICRYQLDFVAPDGRVLIGPSVLGDPIDPEFTMTNGEFYPQNLVHQPHAEEILRVELAALPNVELALGFEVTAVATDDDGATAIVRTTGGNDEFTLTARYLVGCDGGRSMVRAAIGSARVDLGFSEDWLVVDADADPDYYDTIPEGAIFVCDEDLAAVVCKGLHGHVRFDALRLDGKADFRDAAVDRDYTADSIELISRHFDPDKFTITRQAPYRFYAGTSERWRRGRLFVAGDAAHQTPPFAGQGLNMGMRDASNLAFKLDLVLAGRAPDALLDTYEEERKPACIATIKGAVHNGGLIQTTNRWKIRLRNTIFFLARHWMLAAKYLHVKGMRKPPYGDGLLTESAGAGAPFLRREVLDHTGAPMCIDDLVGFRFGLITSTSPTGAAIDRFRNELEGRVLHIGEGLHDPSGAITRWLTKRDATAVLVRPDHYVFGSSDDPEALCAALLEQLDVSRTPAPAVSGSAS